MLLLIWADEKYNTQKKNPQPKSIPASSRPKKIPFSQNFTPQKILRTPPPPIIKIWEWAPWLAGLQLVVLRLSTAISRDIMYNYSTRYYSLNTPLTLKQMGLFVTVYAKTCKNAVQTPLNKVCSLANAGKRTRYEHEYRQTHPWMQLCFFPNGPSLFLNAAHSLQTSLYKIMCNDHDVWQEQFSMIYLRYRIRKPVQIL